MPRRCFSTPRLIALKPASGAALTAPGTRAVTGHTNVRSPRVRECGSRTAHGDAPEHHLLDAKLAHRRAVDRSVILTLRPRAPVSVDRAYEAAACGATDPEPRFRAARRLSAQIGVRPAYRQLRNRPGSRRSVVVTPSATRPALARTQVPRPPRRVVVEVLAAGSDSGRPASTATKAPPPNGVVTSGEARHALGWPSRRPPSPACIPHGACDRAGARCGRSRRTDFIPDRDSQLISGASGSPSPPLVAVAALGGASPPMCGVLWSFVAPQAHDRRGVPGRWLSASATIFAHRCAANPDCLRANSIPSS